MKAEKVVRPTKTRLKEEARRVFDRVHIEVLSGYHSATVILQNYCATRLTTKLQCSSAMSKADAIQQLLDVLAMLPSRKQLSRPLLFEKLE